MSQAIRYLTDRNIPFRLFRHSSRPSSLSEAAEQRGQSVHQVIRSILFRCSNDEFMMVLAPGPDQISWKSLRSYLKTNRLSLASPEDVFAVTSCRIGAVSPFGVFPPIRILIQDSIAGLDEVSIGSGEPEQAIIIRVIDLMNALPTAEFLNAK